jgi:hypothetical protein
MKAGTENGLGAANILCLPCTACPGLDSFGSFYRFTVYGMIDDDSDSLIRSVPFIFITFAQNSLSDIFVTHSVKADG